MALGIYICYMYLHSRAAQMVTRLDAAAVNLVNIIIDARTTTDIVSIRENTNDNLEDKRFVEGL